MKEFDIIYKEYAEKLYKFTVKLCGDSHIAEDIVQTTFLKAFESADKFKGNCQVYTWLCTIARNEYFNYGRPWISLYIQSFEGRGQSR